MAWWTLKIDGKENLTEEDKEHIAELIKDGFTSGDLLDDEEKQEQEELEEAIGDKAMFLEAVKKKK